MTKRILVYLSLLLLTTPAFALTTYEQADMIVQTEVIETLEKYDTEARIRAMTHMIHVFETAAEILKEIVSKTEIQPMTNQVFERDMVAIHNQYRRKNNVKALSRNHKLHIAAFNKCTYMNRTKDFAHHSIDWKSYTDYIDESWYQRAMCWENIAVGSWTPQSVMNAFKRSPTHYENLMQPRYDHIWIALVGEYICVEFWDNGY